jgi:hypothetical protein
VDQHVASFRQLLERSARPRIARVDHGARIRIQPQSQAGEIGLRVGNLGRLHPPVIRFDDASLADLSDIRGRWTSRFLASPRPVHVQARVPLGPGFDVWPEDSVRSDQPIDQPRDRWRTIDLELGYLGRSVVPSSQQEPWKVDEVVIVQVREEGVGDIGRPCPRLQEPMMAARSMIEDDDVVGEGDHVAWTHALQRRGRVTRAQQRDLHQLPPEGQRLEGR